MGAAFGGTLGLIDLIDRFGPEIEYDLAAELGVDLLEFFRAARPWTQLERFLARLPSHGHYKAALADDDVFARQYLEAHPDPAGAPSRAPTMLGWSPVYGLLVAQLETMRQHIAITVACNSEDGQVDKPDPLPHPVTAIERAQDALRRNARAARMAVLLPDQDPDNEQEPPITE